MCRYAGHSYKGKMACFACRKSWRQLVASVCPQCGGSLASMGLDFKAPPQRDKRAWAVVKALADGGATFDSCGCGGPGARPETMHEAKPFLARKAVRDAGMAALDARVANLRRSSSIGRAAGF